jgi:hypothetical protein
MKMTATQNRTARELDDRLAAGRPTSWQNPDSLPMPNERPGWKHRYIRISMMGTADPSNISSKLREGYEPVKAEDYPELMMHANTEGRFKGNVEIGGLLLCRIPEEFLKQRADFYNKQNKAQMDSVDNTFMKDSDPRMPLFAEKRSKVTFGSGS